MDAKTLSQESSIRNHVRLSKPIISLFKILIKNYNFIAIKFTPDVANKLLTVVGPEGSDTLVLEKLNKWVRHTSINF